MNKADFAKSKPGKLVKVRRGVYGFYPDPLPPAFEPDWEIARAISRTGRALGELSGVARMVPEEFAGFHGLFARAEAIASMRLEGVSAALRDLLVHENTGAPPPSGAAAEVFRLVRAVEKAAGFLRDVPLSLSLAQDMGETMFEKRSAEDTTPGRFRAGRGRGGVEADEISGYIPPPEAQTRVALFAFDKFLKTPGAIPPAARAALIFYQFTAIRPFEAGNGRIARALPGLSLLAEGASPLPILFISDYLGGRMGEFRERFLGVVHDGRWGEWLEFVLAGIGDGARRMAEIVERLLRLRAGYHETLREGRSSQVLPQLVDALFRNPAITTAGAAELLRVTFRAAQLNIDKLAEMGALEEATGRRRNRVYIARGVVGIMEAGEIRNTPEIASG